MPPDLEQSTTVARLATDEATAHRIIDLVTESYDPLAAVAGVSEEAPDRWAVAIHFAIRRTRPPCAPWSRSRPVLMRRTSCGSKRRRPRTG